LHCDLRKASKFMTAQKEQLQSLKQTLRDRDVMASQSKLQYDTAHLENKALEQSLSKMLQNQKQLLQTINKNDDRNRKNRRNIKLLDAEVADNGCRQEQLLMDIQTLKKEKSNTLKASESLQHEIERMGGKLNILQEEKDFNMTSSSKLNDLKEAKKRYKKDIRYLSKSVEELKQQLCAKDQTIDENTKVISDWKKLYEQKQRTFEDNYLEFRKSRHESDTQLGSLRNKLNDVKEDRNELIEQNKTLHDENTRLSKYPILMHLLFSSWRRLTYSFRGE